ncbi:GTP cyclohydrolase I FolE2 [Yangia mangrovi]|uniref:GTP cyclohydrolase FolE2 n=1 Tax=Alloyangia mangrovi TaxID=1779329 RepID=A0A2A3JTC4_9RHOB|nr:GTP cyclohydrolase FolE2 [Alloyangia mangrovi]MCA0939285.1 GTP cyclohydrolase FolE2 [Alloyangia pacifica]MCA0943665.1 GTP cyclohydrolase FolE2 [Alloyangia pacifica]MCT4372497.1 GTP cyclohydrolase I FolE2 [Alloyangia mangrovi]
MNVYSPVVDRNPSRDDAEAALAVLRQWTEAADDSEITDLDPALLKLLGAAQDYPIFSRQYPEGFSVDDAYKTSLPDLQNGPASLIRGENVRIQHVGISNFRLPISYRLKDGSSLMLETSVTGTVSLEADKKGINMSRIMRSFYTHAEKNFSFGVIEAALNDYKSDLESFDARIQMRFSFPMTMTSLRSGLSGYQYYDLALELVEQNGVRQRIAHLDYVYSSTCPCSLELSEHARQFRGQLATPHSQRSVARVSVVLEDDSDDCLWFEDLVGLCRDAVPTETQVMVKREDEQAFAELNAANPIFVEDAARLFAEAMAGDERIGDFRVMCSHQESLHSHDAVALLTQGTTFAQTSLDPTLFPSLIHRG